MTRKEVERMIKAINQKIIYQDQHTIEVESGSYCGEPITFCFDDDGKLIEIDS